MDPILLFMIVQLASDRRLMGEHALSGWWKAVAWLTILVISAFVAVLLWGLLFGGR